MTPSIRIGDREVSANQPCYIIAEIGVNHNGDASLAHQMIDAAHEAGADAVKFQTYLTDELVTPLAPQAAYQTENMGEEASQAQMLRQYELSFSIFRELRDHCDELGVDFISTAFDRESLNFVVSLEPACLKWASGEITNRPLIEQAASSSLPLLLSTGMCNLTDVSNAVDWLNDRLPLIILQCVSNYPSAIEEQNLKTLATMSASFGCPTGFSDHTVGPYAAIAARSLGMSVLEKHFTLDKNLPGPDHRASMEPQAFDELVTLVRSVEAALGTGVKQLQNSETNTRKVARKSLVYSKDLPAGHILDYIDLTAKRPGTGLPPAQVDLLLGQKLVTPVQQNQMASQTHVQ